MTYNGLKFKTELEAQWAAFFDLAGWQWWTNPIEINGWKPDFKIQFPCDHSECGGYHTLYVEVVPESDIGFLMEQYSASHTYDITDNRGNWVADAGAAFGDNPSSTFWEMSHGSGGGVENVTRWVDNAQELWKEAALKVKKYN